MSEEATETTDEEPKKKKGKFTGKRKEKKAAKAKKEIKAKKATNGNGEAGPWDEFGIRAGGERAAVLMALLKPVGRKHAAAELAKLTSNGTTTAVAVIVDRIGKKAAKYKLPYKVFVEKTDEGRVYALQKK